MKLTKSNKATSRERDIEPHVYEDHLILDNGRNQLRLRRMTWGSNDTEDDAKWDLRRWREDDEGNEKCYKGVSLSNDELVALAEFCKGIEIDEND